MSETLKNTLGTQFVLHARRVQLVDVDERPVSNSFMKFCPPCGEMTMHERYEEYTECLFCHERTTRHVQQPAAD